MNIRECVCMTLYMLNAYPVLGSYLLCSFTGPFWLLISPKLHAVLECWLEMWQFRILSWNSQFTVHPENLYMPSICLSRRNLSNSLWPRIEEEPTCLPSYLVWQQILCTFPQLPETWKFAAKSSLLEVSNGGSFAFPVLWVECLLWNASVWSFTNMDIMLMFIDFDSGKL